MLGKTLFDCFGGKVCAKRLKKCKRTRFAKRRHRLARRLLGQRRYDTTRTGANTRGQCFNARLGRTGKRAVSKFLQTKLARLLIRGFCRIACRAKTGYQRRDAQGKKLYSRRSRRTSCCNGQCRRAACRRNGGQAGTDTARHVTRDLPSLSGVIPLVSVVVVYPIVYKLPLCPLICAKQLGNTTRRVVPNALHRGKKAECHLFIEISRAAQQSAIIVTRHRRDRSPCGVFVVLSCFQRKCHNASLPIFGFCVTTRRRDFVGA